MGRPRMPGMGVMGILGVEEMGIQEEQEWSSRGSGVKEKGGLGEMGWLETECKVLLVLDKGVQGGSCAREGSSVGS